MHEHPEGATSWQDHYVRKIMGYPNVLRVSAHMCPFEMTAYDEEGAGLVKKPTGWMTNSPKIAKALSRRCTNELGTEKWHRHVLLMGGKAKACQVYPMKLVKAILKGLKAQLRADLLLQLNHVGTVCCEEAADQAQFDEYESDLWDEVYDARRKRLDPKLVHQARVE